MNLPLFLILSLKSLSEFQVSSDQHSPPDLWLELINQYRSSLLVILFLNYNPNSVASLMGADPLPAVSLMIYLLVTDG